MIGFQTGLGLFGLWVLMIGPDGLQIALNVGFYLFVFSIFLYIVCGSWNFSIPYLFSNLSYLIISMQKSYTIFIIFPVESGFHVSD